MDKDPIQQESKILLVENSRTARAIMKKLFIKQGFAVTMANSGMEALTTLKEGATFNAIVMDIFMPQLNGYEAAKEIRAMKGPSSTLPIIALTGSTDPADKELCLQAGMNDFVHKSKDLQELFDVLKQYRSAPN